MLLWVVFLIITNMNYVACEVEDIPKNTSIQVKPEDTQAASAELMRKVQQIQSFNPDFIEAILSDQHFFHSAISSVSHVFYNDWVKKLNRAAQIRYLKIMFMNIKKADTASQSVSQYFDILSKIFQDQEIGKVLLHHMKFHQNTTEFQKYIQKKHSYLSDLNFNELTYNQQCQLFIMALNDFYNDYSYNFKYLPTQTSVAPPKNQSKVQQTHNQTKN